jgi:hypothetical protein
MLQFMPIYFSRWHEHLFKRLPSLSYVSHDVGLLAGLRHPLVLPQRHRPPPHRDLRNAGAHFITSVKTLGLKCGGEARHQRDWSSER